MSRFLSLQATPLRPLAIHTSGPGQPRSSARDMFNRLITGAKIPPLALPSQPSVLQTMSSRTERQSYAKQPVHLSIQYTPPMTNVHNSDRIAQAIYPSATLPNPPCTSQTQPGPSKQRAHKRCCLPRAERTFPVLLGVITLLRTWLGRSMKGGGGLEIQLPWGWGWVWGLDWSCCVAETLPKGFGSARAIEGSLWCVWLSRCMW